MFNHQRLGGAIGLCTILGACQATPAAVSAPVPVSGPQLASWVKSDASATRTDVAVRIQLTIPVHSFLNNALERWLVRYSLDNDPVRDVYINAQSGATALNMGVPLPDTNPHQLGIRQVVSHDYLFLALSNALAPLRNIPVRSGDGVILKIPMAINQPT